MKLFECQNCGQQLYFENFRCEKCGCALGYASDEAELLSLKPGADNYLYAISQPPQAYRYCANARYEACNWLIPAAQPADFCTACNLNRTIPNLANPEHLLYWKKLELAKHRLVYALLRLNLPVMSKFVQPEKGLAFDFLADPDPQFRDSDKVMTGHAEGLITINIAEANDAEREKQRLQMAEPYRTLLGHFRHESGHYYWELLIKDTPDLAEFRRLFGDERLDYAQALEQHYAQPHPNWQTEFISSYASSHPWEDWAETWAHYLHIIDTLETAFAFGLRVRPLAGQDKSLKADIRFDPYQSVAFERVVEAWLPLSYAINSLTRSMGEHDFYPFVLTSAVLEKLKFIHTLIQGD